VLRQSLRGPLVRERTGAERRAVDVAQLRAQGQRIELLDRDRQRG